MLTLLVIWAVLLTVLVIFAIGRPSRGGALTLAYFLGWSLIHVPGVLPFLSPDSGLDDFDETQLGFETTVLGMAAYVAGAVVARLTDRGKLAPKLGALARQRAQTFARLGWRALALGVVAYFVLIPLSGSIPSLTSIVSAFGTLLVVGLWLALYAGTAAADRRRTLMTLALLPLLPLATLATGGFLGFGISWVLSIIAFLFVITRHRIWFYLSAPVVVFLGLSLFVTYLGQREGIRELVWYEEAGMVDRLERISAMVTEFQMLDLGLPAHISALDDRLNQNLLVGAAITYHESGAAGFAFGGTLPPWGLIPRALWPDKPVTGGGLDVVTEFTGLTFAEGTSVGAGQVLEFYVNFGIPGVLVGFLGLSCLLMRLDHGIMRALAKCDARGLLLRAMPGLMLMHPGGNLLEIVVGCAAAYLGAHLLISLRFFDAPLAVQSRRQMA